MGLIFGKIREETPSHTVLHATSDYQIWRYASSVAATVRSSSLSLPDAPAPTARDFESAAFRLLARYIGVFSTPQNKAAAPAPPRPESIAMTAPVVLSPPPEKIAMTAPVVLASHQSQRAMTFLLPAKYETVEQAPVPDNDAVQLSLAPAGRCEAVLTYSGNIDMDSAAEKAKVLAELLQRDGVRMLGPWTVHGYNAPFVLPWCKRNEIHIPVDPDSIKDNE